MPLKSNLTDKEFIDFLHCRITALELFISAKDQYFAEWVDTWISEEIDVDPVMTFAQKSKLKTLAATIKTRFKKKED